VPVTADRESGSNRPLFSSSMGVPGLWDLIHASGESRSLGSLAVVDGFEKNISGRRVFWFIPVQLNSLNVRRALRVGIDVSLWFHQVTRKNTGGAELGDNPQLRTLFFRLCALGTDVLPHLTRSTRSCAAAEWPILPLFVFDGRQRPKVKVGTQMVTMCFPEFISCLHP